MSRPGPEVDVVPLPRAAIEALAEGDLAAAQSHVTVRLGEWLVSDEERWVWRYRARQVAETPDDLPWVTGVIVDTATGAGVGHAGFHGAPDAEGMVEAGYAVDPAHRRRGYARAALAVLVRRAQEHPDVVRLRVTVSPDNHASLSLLRELPLVRVGEQWDEEDGLEDVYEMPVGAPRA